MKSLNYLLGRHSFGVSFIPNQVLGKYTIFRLHVLALSPKGGLLIRAVERHHVFYPEVNLSENSEGQQFCQAG